MAQHESSIKARVESGVVALGSNILIQPDIASEFAGRLSVPSNIRDQVPTTGRIVKLGINLTREVDVLDDEDKVTRKKLEYLTPLRVGDRVVFSKYAGIQCNFEDQVMMVLKEPDCLLLVDADKPKGEMAII